MPADEFRPFEPSPETSLTNDLAHLAEGWQSLGIDPDDFFRCGKCHKWIPGFDYDDDAPDGVCTCDDE